MSALYGCKGADGKVHRMKRHPRMMDLGTWQAEQDLREMGFRLDRGAGVVDRIRRAVHYAVTGGR